MGNCLKTQLKASVQNDNLPYYDGFVITTNFTFNDAGTGAGKITFTAVNTRKKILSPGVTFCNAQGADLGTTESSDIQVYLPYNTPVGTKVLVTPRYQLTALSVHNFSLDYSFLKYCPNLTLLDYYTSDPSFPEQNLNTDDLADGGVKVRTMDIPNMNANVNLSYFEKVNCSLVHVLLNNKLSGDILSIVKGCVSGGRTEGSLNLGLYNYSYLPARGITFGGTEIIGDMMPVATLSWSTNENTVTATLSCVNQETKTATYQV